MAKKFVRGITDIKNIEHQDFDTNNVNDLLSDGKHNYIHRKKQDGSEEYHNLTDNLKTLVSEDTDLLEVTNDNDTSNSATLHPKHDAQKEQLLESTDETILIEHGENGTDETTNVDVNPAKVLEHDNLISNSDYVTIEHEDDSDTSVISTDVLNSKISEIEAKIPTEIGGRNYIRNYGLTATGWQSIKPAWRFEIISDSTAKSGQCLKATCTTASEGRCGFYKILFDFSDGRFFGKQMTWSMDIKTSKNANLTIGCEWGSAEANVNVTENWQRFSKTFEVASSSVGKAWIFYSYDWEVGDVIYIRDVQLEDGSIATSPVPAIEDVYDMIGQKQNTLTSNTSIGVDGTGLMQLYSYEMSYSNPLEGSLNTYAKTVKKATQLTGNPKLEYHFTAKLNEAIAGMTVELEDDDVTYFTSILTKYGEASGGTKTAMINGLIFTLNESRLTVSRDVSSTAYNQVVSFSDIIDPSQDTNQ